jgi:DNA-binding NtrC family response regulator
MTAADGRAALDKASQQTFDLILLDIKMPGPTGMEVLPQIVNEHPDTCVVMITAVSDTDTAVEAMKLGAYDYVTKPFNLDDLNLRVEKALERKRLVDENRQYQAQSSV